MKKWTTVFAIVLICAAVPVLAAGPAVKTLYVAYRFTQAENWQLRGSGNQGTTQWKAPGWSLDVTIVSAVGKARSKRPCQGQLPGECGGSRCG